jgi:hypothetical protein
VTIIKVGQYPSIADVSERALDRYRKLLGAERLSELKKGVGLHAHGIGIGSIVYLRRAFEFIVDSAEKAAALESKEPANTGLRMQDKIAALSEYLPEFIVDNRVMYGILSDGIHNRSESDCALLFSPCLRGIEIALEQLESKRSQAERANSAKVEIAGVASLLGAMGKNSDS